MNELDHLWSGWRNAYVTTGGEAAGVRADDVAAGRGSVFTRILKSGLPDDETYVVHRSPHAFVILNAFPYGVGHSLVLPYREVAALEDLDAAEAVDLWATVTAAVRATKHAYQPDGLNVGINLGKAAGGSVSQHLHVHVLPRWSGDVSFMTSVANARTMPETLDDTLAKLRAGFAATSGR